MESPMKNPTLFISYSRKDSELAHRLADDLRTAGYSVWVDVGGLRGGQKWLRMQEMDPMRIGDKKP